MAETNEAPRTTLVILRPRTRITGDQFAEMQRSVDSTAEGTRGLPPDIRLLLIPPDVEVLVVGDAEVKHATTLEPIKAL